MFERLAVSRECQRALRSLLQPSPLSYASPLLERTLVLLPPPCLARQGEETVTQGFVQVLDLLLGQAKFELCGMKVVALSSGTLQQVKLLLSLEASHIPVSLETYLRMHVCMFGNFPLSGQVSKVPLCGDSYICTYLWLSSFPQCFPV